MPDKNSAHSWKFHRLGGLDQVILQTADDLIHLDELDSKLWVALSCPIGGLEINDRALALIDGDRDGRIRHPEVRQAVQWLVERLKEPASIIDPPERLPLSFINQETEAGRRLAATGKEVLKELGRSEDDGLAVEEVMSAADKAAQRLYNGDGILPADPALGPVTENFIKDGLALMGGVTGLDGRPGLNQELGDKFLAALSDFRKWRRSLDESARPFGEETQEAWKLMEKLHGKIDDFFLRCDLAAFSPSAAAALDPEFTPGQLDLSTLDQLPLARVRPGRSLDADDGFNPLWRDQMDRFLKIIGPRLSQPGSLTREDWPEIQRLFDQYAAALAAKPVPPQAQVDSPPAGSFDDLDDSRLDELLSDEAGQAFAQAINQDRSSPESNADVADLEKLVLYHRYLYRLLMNFVSFLEFYSPNYKAAFQAGTLHFDGRNCKLCLPVDDVEKHAVLAAFSHLCLIYCQCVRVKKPGEDGPEGTKTIVAAVTAGDADFIMEGRHGVFIDDRGCDWDATIIKYVPNTISLGQAIWEPYKRFGRMVGEQLNKLASTKNDALTNAFSQRLANAQAAPPPAPAKPFDIGKSVGIFAAIGLALGAIGTAVASITGALFSLHWWQWPLVALGIFLLISGPSVFLAWLKLRKRALGPLLDASGWAINTWAPINIMMGNELTDEAALPPNSTRLYNDPLAKPKKRWPLTLLLILVLVLGTLAGWLIFGEGLKMFDDVTASPAPVEAAVTDEKPAPAAEEKTSAAESVPAAGNSPPSAETPAEQAPAPGS